MRRTLLTSVAAAALAAGVAAAGAQQAPSGVGQPPGTESTQQTPRAGDVDRNREPRGAREQRDRGDDRGARRAVTMSEEQRARIGTRFSDRIERMNFRPASRSQVSVSIGVPVPRSVELHAVPSDIVTIDPRFRGLRFVVVEDEIVIVEPRSYQVAAVLPMYGERQGGRAQVRETTGAAGSGSRVRLSAEDRRVIRTVVLREPACRLEQRVDFFLFVPIPKTVEVCQLPQEVVSQVPEVGSYRYVVRDDDVVLVEPDGQRVVEIID